MSGFLVSLSGIDGSGKTTLAQSVTTLLQDRGLPFRYTWARFGSKLIDSIVFISKSTILHHEDLSNTERSFQAVKSYIFSSRITSMLYLGFVLIDYYLQLMGKVWFPILWGKNLICDRYVFDSVVDLAADLLLNGDTCLKIISIFMKIVPEPKIAFYIDIPVEIAFDRKDDIISIDYLQSREGLFFLLVDRYNLRLIDGCDQPESINDKVTKLIIEEYLKETN